MNLRDCVSKLQIFSIERLLRKVYNTPRFVQDIAVQNGLDVYNNMLKLYNCSTAIILLLC